MSQSHSPELAAFVARLADAGTITVGVMVASADGHATVEGRVGDLTGKADQQVLLGARELASVLVVGGRTVRIEGYEGLLDEAARQRRRVRGLESEPPLAVFTRSAESLPGGAAPIHAAPMADGQPDLQTAWKRLRQTYGDGLIVTEGGPTLLGMLVQQRVLDQLVLCVSPQLVGGQQGKRLLDTVGPLPGGPVGLRVLDVADQSGFVFIRYELA